MRMTNEHAVTPRVMNRVRNSDIHSSRSKLQYIFVYIRLDKIKGDFRKLKTTQVRINNSKMKKIYF